MNARAVVGKGEKSMRSDPGSELHLVREKDKLEKHCQDNRWDGHIKNYIVLVSELPYP